MLYRKNVSIVFLSFNLVFLKTALREEDDLDNLVDETQEVEEEERSRKESSKSNSSTSSSDSNVSINCSVNSIAVNSKQ